MSGDSEVESDGQLMSVVTPGLSMQSTMRQPHDNGAGLHLPRPPPIAHGVSNGSRTVYGDGSWQLSIFVTDLQVERSLRVRGDTHIGGVMIQLVDSLDIAMDWSDHAIWWPSQNKWLDKTRWTLDQYMVNADTIIHFTPMHKTLRIQLPDLRYVDCTVDFSVKTFNASVGMCRDLGLRHPEELSLCKPLDPEHLRQNYQEVMMRRRPPPPTKEPSGDRLDTNTFVSGTLASNGKSPHSTMRTPTKAQHSPHGTLNGNGNYSPYSNGHSWVSTAARPSSPQGPSLDEMSLSMSPPATPEAKNTILKPKGLEQRARMNVGWLDSSLSIMEQGVREFDTLCIRYKYFNFYDLNTKFDANRINQIYEQARWQILNEEIDCTEEEMMLFAALQLQVAMQANVPQPSNDEDETDDVDEDLKKLQISLEGGTGGGGWGDVTEDPSISDYLQYYKPKRFGLKSYKRLYFVCKNLSLLAYKSADSARKNGELLFSVHLKGCEVTPALNLTANKFEVKLEVPSTEGMTEMFLRFISENQYAQWLAACRFAAKGKTLADSGYDAEVNSIKAFLSMQSPASAPAINPNSIEITAEDYVAPRFARKRNSRQLRQKILESHANVKDLNLLESKMNFVRAWQSLPEYGISLFVVRFHGEKKDELLGVSSNRIMRMTLPEGNHLKTWRYSTMKAWNVNWETRHMMIQFEDDKNVIFQCLSADCKVIHEFIGGYIFLSMRSKESNQQLNEELFHKLTGGWL